MQKFLLLLTLSCLLALLAGCAKAEEKEITIKNDTQNESELDVEENVSQEDSPVDIKEEEESIEENQEEKEEGESTVEESKKEDSSTTPNDASIDPGLKVYMPQVGWEKKFMDGEEIVLTEKIIASANEHIQIATIIGGNASIQIFKWTENEITLVYEEVSAEEPTKDILASFTPMDKPEVILSLNEEITAGWELQETGATLEVAYKTFKDVYVVQKVTDDVEDAQTIYTRYYAPGYGLVKESFELTGEYGYTGDTELAAVEK